MSNRILIATQAGPSTGVGRLFRSETLAKVLRDRFQAEVAFWLETEDGTLPLMLQAKGFTVLDARWSLADTLAQHAFDHGVLDFYTPLTPSFIKRLQDKQPNLALVAIGNTGAGCELLDALILPSFASKPEHVLNPNTGLVYQGPEFIVLGASFLATPEWSQAAPTEDPPTLLVTLGATDPNRVTEKTLEALLDLRDCHVDVTVPFFYDTPETLEKVATQMPSTVTLHWKVPSLRPLMQRATLAITAFGLTACELYALKTPSLLFSKPDTDPPNLEAFLAKGTALSLGMETAIEPRHLAQTIMAILSNPTQLMSLREAQGHGLDPSAPDRVAEIILQTVKAPSHVSRS